MNKTAASQPLLQLLVRVYNQSIQSYDHFPEVIICGNYRLERAEFDLLQAEEYIEPYYADSFGKLYHLSKRAHHILQESLHKRRRAVHVVQGVAQVSLPFS